MYDAATPSFLADCPARLTTEILSDKWAALVLFGLHEGPRRHGELVERIGGISRKVLTQTLRHLQEDGLVERRVDDSRRVEYRLTPIGSSLIGPIEALNDWARDNGADVIDHRDGPAASAVPDSLA